MAGPSVLTRNFVADRGDDRRRVDRVLMRHLTDVDGISRTRVQDWVASGLVQVDGAKASRAAQRVLAGHRVEIALDARMVAPSSVTPQDIPLSVLYEDDLLLAIDKPAGLIVHPSYRHADGTLLNALAHRARDWPIGRPSLVNRLDKHTSGILLVAKTGESHAALVSGLREPTARKEYVALCYGRMRAPRRRLRYPLGPDPLDRRRFVVREDGVDAVTEVTRLAESRRGARGLTLVQCRLITGRTHQIRVHLRADGLPIVGDPVYGEAGWRRIRDLSLAERLRAFPRQALHAWRLTFTHPVSKKTLLLEAPVPADLQVLLSTAGLLAWQT